MLNKEPEKHWSFKVDWKDIDVSRILKESKDQSLTCVVVKATFRTGPIIYVFIDGDSKDYKTIEQNTDDLLPVGAHPCFNENGIGELTMEELKDGISGWYSAEFGTDEEASNFVKEIVDARTWRASKQRVTVRGF